DRELDRLLSVVAAHERKNQPARAAVAAANAIDDRDVVFSRKMAAAVFVKHAAPAVAARADRLAQRDRDLLETEPLDELPRDVFVLRVLDFSRRDLSALDAEHALGVLLVRDAEIAVLHQPGHDFA